MNPVGKSGERAAQIVPNRASVSRTGLHIPRHLAHYLDGGRACVLLFLVEKNHRTTDICHPVLSLSLALAGRNRKNTRVGRAFSPTKGGEGNCIIEVFGFQSIPDGG